MVIFILLIRWSVSVGSIEENLEFLWYLRPDRETSFLHSHLIKRFRKFNYSHNDYFLYRISLRKVWTVTIRCASNSVLSVLILTRKKSYTTGSNVAKAK